MEESRPLETLFCVLSASPGLLNITKGVWCGAKAYSRLLDKT